MRLEHVLEIIEFTDSDHLEDAMAHYQAHAWVADTLLPYLHPVYDMAPEALCQHLSRLGFKGTLSIVPHQDGSAQRSYLLFDASRIDAHTAMQLSGALSSSKPQSTSCHSTQTQVNTVQEEEAL
ncbi:hypothetical protein H4F17_09675 [Vibrio cholerae]